MSIYSGSSPFSRGKLGGNKVAGTKTSRGGAKKRSAKIAVRRGNNTTTASSTTSTFRGNVLFASAGAAFNDEDSLIRHINNATVSGNLTSDDLSLTSATGGHLVLTIEVGSNFASSEAALSGKKNLRFIITYEGADYEGLFAKFLSGGSVKRYRVEFLSLPSIATGKAIVLKVQHS